MKATRMKTSRFIVFVQSEGRSFDQAPIILNFGNVIKNSRGGNIMVREEDDEEVVTLL